MNKDLKPKDDLEKQWAAIIHGSAFAGLLFPLALALGPLLIWSLKKDESEYLNIQGRKAINFQLTVLLVSFACVLLSILIKPILAFAFITGIGGLVFAIMAAVMVYKKGDFEYPFYFKLV